MNQQKRLLALAKMLVGLLLVSSAYAQKTQSITLANTSSIALTDKPVCIKRSQVAGLPKGAVYPLIMSAKGDAIPVQLDDLNGDDKWDELFFVANLPANANQTYTLKWVASQPQFTKRTSIRFGKRMRATDPVQPALSDTVFVRDLPKSLGFQRYQTDGPSWENDKVGFRHYLDGRNAKDVFGKRTAEMSPEKVGINAAGAVEDNYHVMEPWGRDILAVGNSIGIGGVALVKGDSIMRLGVTVDDSVNNVEKTVFRIVSEGPARSILNFKYHNWKPANKSYGVEETVSIWPGMYAYHNSVKVSGAGKGENLAIGLVNINATKPPTEIRIGSRWVALVSHEKHTYNKEWWLGLALILPADAYIGFTAAPRTGRLSNSYLAKLKIAKQPVHYYAVAGWELSDEGFRDPAYFQQYVENLARQIAAPVKVSVK